MLYPAAPGPGWRVVFHDEFDGRPCDPAGGGCPAADEARVRTCYGAGSTPAPAVLQHKFHAGAGNVTREARSNLLDLDKCVWAVNDHVNAIHFIGDQQQYVVMKYEPAMLQVARGELLVGTRYAHGAGPCGSNADREDPTGQSCPYFGGGVTTIPFNGLSAAFPKTAGPYVTGDGLVLPSSGRLEIRAKTPEENGNMAALWTWAADPSRWEHEHDILEYFLNWREAHHQGEVQWHGSEGTEDGAWIVSASGATNRYREYHVYAMEWVQGRYLRYLFDGREVARLNQGDPVYSPNQVCRAMEVNGNPFYLIFWNLMTNYWYAPAAAPVTSGQPPDWLHVDWVRLHEECTMGTPGCVESTGASVCQNPCGGFGTWNGITCIAGETPAGTIAAIVGGQFGYLGDATCSHGGHLSGGVCLLGAPPAGRTPSTLGTRFLVSPVCAPTEGIYNCARPCPWPGTVADAHGCYVATAPAGHGAFIYNNAFYYQPVSSEPSTACPYGGTYDSAHCYVGSAPAGAVAELFDGRYYLQVERCAYGGTYDTAANACLFLTPPAGRTAFTYEGNAYYTAAAAAPRCEAGASFDGANCNAGPLPSGADSFVASNRLWLRATCGPVTAPDVFFSSTAVNPDRLACP